MRIIAGTLGGRTFTSPNNLRTHPMSDKIRGALFNTLGDLEDLRVLDAFAGSGALSFEAVSRGASSCIAVENDRQAQRAIAENISRLNLADAVELVKSSAQIWHSTHPDAIFDIVLLDPPYDNLQPHLVNELVQVCSADGTVVLSWPGGQQLPEFDGFRCVLAKVYGDAQLGFYQRV